MARAEMLMVFSYDIADDKRRRRISRILEEIMVRVQESVFESRLSASMTEALVRRLEPEMAPGDSLRVYAVGADSLARCRQVGGAPIAENVEFWLM
jgi:CRISPR-associated protein Cas2